MAAAACGGESAFQVRKDAGKADGSPDMPAADGGMDGGTDGPARDDAGQDAMAADAGDGGATDDAAPDESGADTGVDMGVDTGIDAGALPQFVRAWTFDQAAAGIDGWIRAFGLTASTIMYDPNVGSPNPGSLVLSVPFSSAGGGEQLAIQATTAADLTHRHVMALIRLDSGGPALGRVGYSSTGSYVLVMAPPVALIPGQWTTVTLDVDNPAAGSYIDTSHMDGDGGVIPPTPSDTRVITVVVSTPFSPGTYTTGTFHVDLVGYY